MACREYSRIKLSEIGSECEIRKKLRFRRRIIRLDFLSPAYLGSLGGRFWEKMLANGRIHIVSHKTRPIDARKGYLRFLKLQAIFMFFFFF